MEVRILLTNNSNKNISWNFCLLSLFFCASLSILTCLIRNYVRLSTLKKIRICSNAINVIRSEILNKTCIMLKKYTKPISRLTSEHWRLLVACRLPCLLKASSTRSYPFLFHSAFNDIASPLTVCPGGDRSLCPSSTTLRFGRKN